MPKTPAKFKVTNDASWKCEEKCIIHGDIEHDDPEMAKTIRRVDEIECKIQKCLPKIVNSMKLKIEYLSNIIIDIEEKLERIKEKRDKYAVFHRLKLNIDKKAYKMHVERLKVFVKKAENKTLVAKDCVAITI